MIHPRDILLRLVLWTAVCTVCAAPSFYWARTDQGHPTNAMALGVGIFIVAYTIVTSTTAFERLRHRPFVGRTLRIGYALRLAISLGYPIGMAADLLPGLLAMRTVEEVFGIPFRSFRGTLATTLVQGVYLNVLLILFMLFIYGVQRLFAKATPAPHGFEVIMPVLPLTPPR
jgi:hypothetical protein